ncbi:MAG TPA: peptidoglycan-binding domain-containing protein [Polyangia bacterium]|jgi:peptidoglycan hydrolase-like protein with peptidoglycan-binding domain
MSWTSMHRLSRSFAVIALMCAANGCAHSHAAPPASTVPATKPDHEHAAETGISISSTPQGLMQPGAEKLLQERLRDRGLLRQEQCNGQLDTPTRAALREFQKSEGLPTTGLPSYETVDHLGLDLDVVFHTTAHPRAPVRPATD